MEFKIQFTYNTIFLFLVVYLDTGFHCHSIRVHVRGSVRVLVYVVQEEGTFTAPIISSPVDARSTSAGNGNTANQRWHGGF